MPTENRSSNTEMVSGLLPCPFCGQQDFLIERLDSDASVVICQGLTGPHEACLARGPVGVAQDEVEEQPGRDKAVELWNARVEQHQGEPVAWLYKGTTTGDMLSLSRKEDHFEHKYGEYGEHVKGEPLYAHPTPAGSGEVERLRIAIERQKNLIASLRADLVESYRVSAAAEPSTPVVSIPEGYCLMPRQLTAENGAKALLLGEFKLEVTHECPECLELDEPAEGCEICDGEGEYGQRHTIPWDKIKFIYSKAVKGLALTPGATSKTP